MHGQHGETGRPEISGILKKWRHQVGSEVLSIPLGWVTCDLSHAGQNTERHRAVLDAAHQPAGDVRYRVRLRHAGRREEVVFKQRVEVSDRDVVAIQIDAALRVQQPISNDVGAAGHEGQFVDQFPKISRHVGRRIVMDSDFPTRV